MMPRLALLIDAENIAVAHWPRIAAECEALGRPTVQRLFGDFTEIRLSGWLEIGRRYGLEAVMQLNGGRGKNSADIALAIHAMDLLHMAAVDGFCLVSSDRDFVPLATRLVGAGKAVHVFCATADARRRLGATSVIELASKVEPARATPPPPPIAPPKPTDPPLVAAFKRISNGAAEMPFTDVVRLLREIDPALVAPPGSGKAMRSMLETGHFDRIGDGPATRIGLRRR